MKSLFAEQIIPYVGNESFKFGMCKQEVIKAIKAERLSYREWIDPHKGCTPEVPWKYVEVENSITFCFVEDTLFEIVFENTYEGVLPNGIGIGMSMEEALQRDSSISFNDEDEDYVSKEGYWIEDDIFSGKVVSITVFVPQAEDAQAFFSYKWVSDYKVTK